MALAVCEARRRMVNGPDKDGAGQERARKQRARNWAIFAVLVGLSVLFYVLTIVRMGGKVFGT
jgi:hypothetical protein